MVNALTGKGISLKDANGDFRDTYDILLDISKVWNDMSKMDQAALAEKISGNRQQNVLFSILTNFNEAEKAMSLMDDSAGALTSSYETYLDSVQGKINQFKASWTELANTVISSDFLKGAVDSARTFLELLNGITGAIGSLPTMIGAIAGAASFRGHGELITQFHSRLY